MSEDEELKEIAAEYAEAAGRLNAYRYYNVAGKTAAELAEAEDLQMRAEVAFARAAKRREAWIAKQKRGLGDGKGADPQKHRDRR